MAVAEEKQGKIDEILEFVERHRESHASRSVCREILGDYYVPFDHETKEQLKERLTEVEEDRLNYCYYLVR